MATEAMVLAALEQAAVSAVYPSGSPGDSVTGRPIPVYPGWPTEEALDEALKLGETHISIYPMPSMFRRTTRWQPVPHVVVALDCTLTASVSGATATFAGTCAAGQLAGVLANGIGYAHAVLATDTPATVAAALGAIVPGATAVGAVLTVATNRPIEARAVASATTATETRRQERGFQISVWADNPDDRDTVADAVDGALAAIDFLPLADGTAGRLLKHGDSSSDASENAGLFRRDLINTVEWSTVSITISPRVLFPCGFLHLGSAVLPFGDHEPAAVQALT
jgi:hypothetical protein